jgi:bifunctional non-homologous end joining protein LigD
VEGNRARRLAFARAEGVVGKRRAGLYRSGPSRAWLKTKCSEVGRFVITGFRDLAPGEIAAVTVAEVIEDKLLPTGEVRFGVGRGLREVLEAIRRTCRAACPERG